MTLQPRIRTQYIELLIKLVELNNDHTWLPYFLRLRNGEQLPGGGAGSLNDWGPSYMDLKTQVWFSRAYDITKYLLDGDLEPTQIDSNNSIKFNNNIQVIRCLNCNKSYQHPRIFESYFALYFFKKNFDGFTESNRLIEIIKPEQTFDSNGIIEYRNWLLNEYTNNNIKVYDFVSANYVCPHCAKVRADIDHDLYKIDKTISGDNSFILFKQNASWADFQK